MNIKEYKQLLLDDFMATSEANETSPETEFINFAVEMFNDTEEVYDLLPCYFTMRGEFNRKILIDGYAYEESDKSYTFFISKFDNSEEITTITQTDINNFVKNMEAFIENSISRFIQKNSEISSEGNLLADTVWRRYNAGLVSKFKLYVITNCLLSESVKTIKYHDIANKPVEVNVWDINRFYNADENNRKKEPIFIDVRKYCNGVGLPAIKAFDGGTGEYTAYLAVIPATLLATIYDEFGSRLLEGNVRSFLSAAGKVNKGIKETILKEPKYFFTYNNGIATTATEIETTMTEDGLQITAIKDLQIINGGQTTASLLNTKINFKKETRLEEIFVAMKLTVINNDNSAKMIEKISRCANSQNKVSDADFFSNSPFHIRYEQLSRSNLAPAVNGNQYQTMWFYERARGSYKQSQMKLTTKSQRDKFTLLHPKSQVITKTDLAKFMNSYYQLPHWVSRGAQKNMKPFAEKIEKIESQSLDNINDYFFKQSIAVAIIFKELEKEVKRASWFPEGSGYRANIVTYTISKLFYCIENQCKKLSLNFDVIWNKQNIYPELRRVLIELAKITFDHITSPKRMIMNVTEWCKKEECWDLYKKEDYSLPDYFVKTLIDFGEVSDKKKAAKKEAKINNEISNEIEVVKLGSKYWERLMMKAKEMGICNIIEEGDLRVVIRMERTGIPPNKVQAKRLLDFRKKCSSEGIDVDNI